MPERPAPRHHVGCGQRVWSHKAKRLSLALFAAASISQASLAQTPAPSVRLSFGVDTSIVEVRDIVRLMRAYLAQPDSSARTRGLWSKASSFDIQYGDVAREAYQGFPATILGVTGTGPGDSVFIVKVIHAGADSSRKQINPLALQRFFAVRAPLSPFGWQLSSPVPRITHNWPRRDVGRITLHYGPGQSYSPQKAMLAARFVDSVARLFSVPPPKHLDVYLAGTLDESQRVLGLDFSVENSGAGTGFGGRSVGEGIILVGDAAVGEAYLHELVHAVLGPLKSRNSIFGEGVAVWLGGSGGKSLKETYTQLRDYQRQYPELSLSGLFSDDPPGGYNAVTALYATRGLIVDAIYRHSGIAGLQRFARLSGSPDDILKLLPQYLSHMNGSVDQWWRTETALSVNR